MGAFIRNPELKSVIVKLLIVQFIMLLAFFIAIHSSISGLNKRIVESNTALIGHVLARAPYLENEIVKYVTQGAQEEEIKTGEQILSQYGYTVDMSVKDQSALAGEETRLLRGTVVLVLFFAILLVAVILWEYRKLFGKIRTVTVAAEQVIEGGYGKVLRENDEGDFGALGRSFNAMAGRLNHSLEQLKQEKTFLSNLLSDISHQLKAPLASLIIYNDNLLNDPRMKEEMKGKFLNRSRQMLERMEWLIVSLLMMARVEAGTIVFRLESVPLRTPVENAVQALKALSEQKKQAITIEGGQEIRLPADEGWLTEAFINVIKNGIEHTPEGGSIRIQLEETLLFHIVKVRDNGAGIDPKEIPHIFKRFYKGQNAVKPESVGIGLSLTRSIIEGHGGTITVQSKMGVGTEFTIAFPKSLPKGKLT
jgi:signal transduction histidine kinase